MTDKARTEHLSEMYRAQRSRLESIARRRIGPADAADIVQDVFASLWSTACAGVKLTPAYLAQATRFTAISHFRAKTRRDAVLAGLTEEQYAPPAPQAEQILAARQALRQIEITIQALPLRTRQVFLLNRLHGCSYEEIAVGLGISTSTVEREMARAILACKAGA